MNQRGPQLNSKCFKGVTLNAADQIPPPAQPFDWVIATGFSCYYPLDYWAEVLAAVKKVLKPDGQFVFDVLDPETPLAENWAILETYLGAEVQLEALSDWEKLIAKNSGKITTRQPGELFQLYRVSF
jgi:SAM-dependent methyltransferase